MYTLVDPGDQLVRWKQAHTDDLGLHQDLGSVLDDLLALRPPRELTAVTWAVDGHGAKQVSIPGTATLVVSEDPIARELILIDIDGLCA